MKINIEKLKEALGNYMGINNVVNYYNKYKIYPDQVIHEAARAYVDLPEEIEGMKKLITYKIDDFGMAGADPDDLNYNQAIDDILNLIK